MRVLGEDVLAFPCGAAPWWSPTTRSPGGWRPSSTTLACRPAAHPSRQPGSMEDSPRWPAKTTCPRCSENPDDGGHCANGTHQDTPAWLADLPV